MLTVLELWKMNFIVRRILEFVTFPCAPQNKNIIEATIPKARPRYLGPRITSIDGKNFHLPNIAKATCHPIHSAFVIITFLLLD